MARLSIHGLTVRFGAFTAVDGVDLDIEDGELVVCLGPSGCGKTTTLRCIAGLERASAGDILFDGLRVNDLHPIERNVAMVFQFVSLYPHLKVKDNIAFPLRARKMGQKAIREKLDWVTEVFKLDDILHRYPLGLPPGTKQKVALARAVVREPRVLLLDEPLSAIDEQYREEMRWELRHLQKQLGFTTVYVTHDQREAMSLADRVVLMRDGRIAQLGTPEQLYTEPASQFAGFFIGSPAMNFIDVAVADGRLMLGAGDVALPVDRAVAARLTGHGPLTLGVRPQHISLASDIDTEGAFSAPIVDRYRIGQERYFDFRIGEELYQGTDAVDITDESTGPTQIRLAMENVHFFHRETGERLDFGRAPCLS